MRRFITSKQFRDNPDRDAIVIKMATTGEPEQVGHETSRTIRFIISNETKDRSGDICKLSGWRLNNYLKNPVVLFEHDADNPPVGKCVEIGVVNDALVATVEFMPASVPIYGARAEAIFQMCKTGYLNATSVGFKTLDFERSKDKDGHMIFKEMELCEFSIVTIPDNPQALILPNANLLPKSMSNINNSDRMKVRRERELVLLKLKN